MTECPDCYLGDHDLCRRAFIDVHDERVACACWATHGDVTEDELGTPAWWELRRRTTRNPADPSHVEAARAALRGITQGEGT